MTGRGSLSRSRNLHAAVTTEVIAALDKWIASQPGLKPNRADAVRLALDNWLTSLGLLKRRQDRKNLDDHIEHLEDTVADLKPAASGEPSPDTGMAMLRKARAKNDLTKAKNKRAEDEPK